jgi:hypothetical protein
MLHHLRLTKGATMGSFINSQSDNEICEVLNKRFSDDVNAQGQTYLNELRGFFSNKEKLFTAGHKLNRVFHRLAISVTGGASVPKTTHSRLRWFHLLKGNLPQAVDQAIRDQLTAILSQATDANPAGGVDYVTFSTVHQSTTTGDQFELFDKNSSTPTVLSDANGKSYCALILQCNVDTALNDAPGESDPPQSDGNNVEKGPIPFAKPKTIKKKPAAKKSATKKKAVKKVAKKAKKGKSRR